MSERTPQDVLRELRAALLADLDWINPLFDSASAAKAVGEYRAMAKESAVRLLDEADKAIAEAPDSPLQGGRWTTERRPEDDAECERLGCEDRTHPVHHWIPDTLSEKPGLDAIRAEMDDARSHIYDGPLIGWLVSPDSMDRIREILWPRKYEADSTDSEGR